MTYRQQQSGERVGISPRMAQTLARHSDIRLTMSVYTHVELNDQKTAIQYLPPPPTARPEDSGDATTAS
jgi:integrase